MIYKNIHIGQLIEQKWKEENISIERTTNFLKCSENDIKAMFNNGEICTKDLLSWSKLLEYDFFRLYSQHLILYAPVKSEENQPKMKSNLPEFKKNIYTKEVIDFLVGLVVDKKCSSGEVIDKYKIPKTTFYKWLQKRGISAR